MVKLDKNNYRQAYEKYKDNTFFFPLIAAVLLDLQDGTVYTDNPDSPCQFYAEHGFGFSQLFGNPTTRFMQALEEYFFIEKQFIPEKIRLYSPDTPGFLTRPRKEAALSKRQRFYLDYNSFLKRKNSPENSINDIHFCDIEMKDIALIEDRFNVVSRFWRTPEEFVKMAYPCLVLYKGEPASICYSAATAGGRAEIDVLTLPDFRKTGLGSYAVSRFIVRCYDAGITPLWDCFANNEASMALAKSMGFTPAGNPYDFFTINKQDLTCS